MGVLLSLSAGSERSRLARLLLFLYNERLKGGELVELFLTAVFAVSSVGALVLSALRYRLERNKDNVWETAVRLMASDPDSRIRADDFADLYTALR